MRCLGCVIVAAAALAAGGDGGAAVAADDFNMGVTTAGIRLGGHVSGPQVTSESLAHRVVLLEFWGVHCPPCIASMPKLEEAHKELAPLGLVVVGAHAQGGPADAVRKTAADLGVTFTIVEEATVQGGQDFNGIPHCMLFDHTGTCVYRGSPFRAHDAIVAAVKAAQQLANLQALRANVLKAFGDEPDGAITPEMVQAVPAAMKRQMADVIRGIQKTAPGSDTAATALALAAEFDLDVAAEP